MKPLILSEKCLDDLRDILNYISRDKPLAATQFVQKLIEQCEFLASFPDVGTGRDDLALGLRLFTYRGYCIYFRNAGEEVRIERVLHPSFDVRKLSFD